MSATVTAYRQERLPQPALASCEHRTVSKQGKIVCKKIMQGENEVSPDVCRTCPSKSVNCGHLRFSLEQTTPSPLIVRFNGRTEIWDDDPPELRFDQAACSEKVMPIYSPKQCMSCPLRKAIRTPGQGSAVTAPVTTGAAPQPESVPETLPIQSHPRRRPAATRGKMGNVVPFPSRRVVAAAG